MIITNNNLDVLQKKVIMVDGGFDPLHSGHIKYFEEASKLGHPVFCNVRGDKYITDNKSRINLLNEEERVQLIDALKSISYTYLCNTSTVDTLQKLKPVLYVKGNDWKHRKLPDEEIRICKENDIKIVYLDTVCNSSTRIFEELAPKIIEKYTVSSKSFEDFLFSQKSVNSDYYDNEYFHGEWRKQNESYSLEKRRAIEAKNPQNIMEVFNPTNILDVGCGPGALMLFLKELGADVAGIDFSAAAKKAAHPDVRDNIYVGSVTDHHDFSKKFDLVICRELLEHLTVLQVYQAVKVLSRYTTKFLYVTTRFHPLPKGLLDVTTDFQTDPSHITAMNKDFLRVLFNLEGLHSRYDLEAKMDWKQYGRVMVFERI